MKPYKKCYLTDYELFKGKQSVVEIRCNEVSPFQYIQFLVLFTGCREYHVQFFGDAAERAWISMNNLLEFQGKEKFDEHTQALYAAAKNSKELKKLKEWYGVKPNRVKAVNIGIAQAETALPLNRQERKAKFTFTYKLPKGKLTESVSEKLKELDEDLKIIQGAERGSVSSEKPSKKRKHEEVATPSKTPKNSTKRRKLETPKSETKVDSPVKIGKKSSSSSRVKAVTEGSFEVFCENLRGSMLLEHPEFTEDALMDYCRQQWCMMSKQQKARYKKTKRGESGNTFLSCLFSLSLVLFLICYFSLSISRKKSSYCDC